MTDPSPGSARRARLATLSHKGKGGSEMGEQRGFAKTSVIRLSLPGKNRDGSRFGDEGEGAMAVSFVRRFAFAGLTAWLIACPLAAKADTRIVAIGASNTAGFGAGFGQSYPAQLEAMLKAHGYKVQV